MKAGALKKTFDRSDQPGKVMLQHYQSSSNPLDKYLVAGLWAHEYLRGRGAELEAFDQELCRMLSCADSAAGRMVLSYATIGRALAAVEEEGRKAAEAMRISSS